MGLGQNVASAGGSTQLPEQPRDRSASSNAPSKVGARLKAGLADSRRRLRQGWGIVLRSPRLRLLLVGATAAMVQAGLILPAMPLFLLSRGFSFGQLGFLFSLVALAALTLRFLLIQYQERLGSAWLVVPLAGVPAITFPFYLVVDAPIEYLAVTTVAMSAGVVQGMGYQIVATKAIPRNHLTQGFALFRVLTDMGYALGLVLGGLLMARSFVLVFYTAALVSVISMFAAAALVIPRALQIRRRKRLLAHAWDKDERWRRISELRATLLDAHLDIGARMGRISAARPLPAWCLRNVNLVSVHMLLFGTALFMYPVFFPQILVTYGLRLEWVGVVIAASWVVFGLAQVVGGVLADVSGRYVAIIVGSLVLAAAMNVIMWWGTLTWTIAAWIALGLVDGIGRPVTQSYMVSSITAQAVAFGFAMTESALGFTRVLGPLVFALIISNYGLRSGLLGAAAMMLAAGLVITGLRRPAVSARAPTGAFA